MTTTNANLLATTILIAALGL